MIIVKTSNILNNEMLLTISTILFNMEMGEKIFNPSGDFYEIIEDYHVLHKDGISYTIQGMVGNIVVMYGMANRVYIEKLALELGGVLSILDDRYIKKYGNIKQYTEDSTDFTLVSQIYKGDIRRTIKISPNNNSITQGYEWKMSTSINKDILKYQESSHKTRSMWEYLNLTLRNTLYIDANNVFNTTNQIAFIEHTPTIDDYSMSELLVCKDAIIYDTQLGGIHHTLRLLKDPKHAHCVIISTLPMCIPIYEDLWVNINPIRVSVHTHDDVCGYILKTLNTSYDYTLMELEEVKNMEDGVPITVNDVCHSCEMYLYDYIYVLEKNTNHICVCAICYHGIIYPKLVDKLIGDNIQTLKVKYPRSIIDVINILVMSDDMRDLLIELSTCELVITTSCITTPNYAGYKDINSVLLKNIIPPENKKLFIWEIAF
jgi:hypothetical protein